MANQELIMHTVIPFYGTKLYFSTYNHHACWVTIYHSVGQRQTVCAVDKPSWASVRLFDTYLRKRFGPEIFRSISSLKSLPCYKSRSLSDQVFIDSKDSHDDFHAYVQKYICLSVHLPIKLPTRSCITLHYTTATPCDLVTYSASNWVFKLCVVWKRRRAKMKLEF